jgi:Domain of unknown function (DUF3127)
MSLELTGKIIQLLDEQTGTGKNGQWVKQDFIVETIEQYPKKVCMSAWGDQVQQIKLFPVGNTIKASIRIESREYNGRWYTDVRPWKIEGVNTGAPAQPAGNYAAPQPQQYATAPVAADPMGSMSSESDDLPF